MKNKILYLLPFCIFGCAQMPLEELYLGPKRTLSTDQVTAWNTSNYCGINTWTLNTKVEASGKTCNGSVVPAIGAIDYDIIKYYFTEEFLREYLEKIPAGSLTFGKSQDGANGKTSASKKNTIETKYLYKKNQD